MQIQSDNPEPTNLTTYAIWFYSLLTTTKMPKNSTDWLATTTPFRAAYWEFGTSQVKISRWAFVRQPNWTLNS